MDRLHRCYGKHGMHWLHVATQKKNRSSLSTWPNLIKIHLVRSSHLTICGPLWNIFLWANLPMDVTSKGCWSTSTPALWISAVASAKKTQTLIALTKVTSLDWSAGRNYANSFSCCVSCCISLSCWESWNRSMSSQSTVTARRSSVATVLVLIAQCDAPEEWRDATRKWWDISTGQTGHMVLETDSAWKGPPFQCIPRDLSSLTSIRLSSWTKMCYTSPFECMCVSVCHICSGTNLLWDGVSFPVLAHDTKPFSQYKASTLYWRNCCWHKCKQN